MGTINDVRMVAKDLAASWKEHQRRQEMRPDKVTTMPQNLDGRGLVFLLKAHANESRYVSDVPGTDVRSFWFEELEETGYVRRTGNFVAGMSFPHHRDSRHGVEVTRAGRQAIRWYAEETDGAV